MTVILDVAHGHDVGGKRSPDGRLLEWKYSREVVADIRRQLEARGVATEVVTPELHEIGLNARVRRVNDFCKRHGGAASCVLVSVHVNAASADGKWHEARGWSVFVGPNASAKSKRLASLLADKAAAAGLTVRRQYADKGYWVQSLAMVRDTVCPAVLTENLFQDNEQDVEWLLSDEGRRAIAQLHVDAIMEYLCPCAKGAGCGD